MPDIIPEKVNMINNRISPIKDECIEDYFKNKNSRNKAKISGQGAMNRKEQRDAFLSPGNIAPYALKI